MKIKLREKRKEDENYIYSSWLKSYYFHSGENNASWETKGIRKSIFMIEHAKVLNKLMEASKILVACDEDDEDFLLGYLVYEDEPDLLIHYIFVRYEARKKGLANEMLNKIRFQERLNNKEFVWFSHLTGNGSFITKNKGLNLNYNPYLKHLG